jgi:hypothetical protein
MIESGEHPFAKEAFEMTCLQATCDFGEAVDREGTGREREL